MTTTSRAARMTTRRILLGLGRRLQKRPPPGRLYAAPLTNDTRRECDIYIRLVRKTAVNVTEIATGEYALRLLSAIVCPRPPAFNRPDRLTALHYSPQAGHWYKS